MKRIYIESLGCAKNQVDSEILLSYAIENGYERTEDAAEADVIVVNTCGFIESAKKESIDTFFSLHELNPDARMILAGCLAERYGREMELEEADAIFGNRDLSLFPAVLEGKEKLLIPDYPDPDKERDDRKVLLNYPGSAYLKISEGCNHRCAYCAIPVIRGPLRSRPMDRIIAEAERLISEGVYEINIVAQDLGAYGTDNGGSSRFVELMDRLSSLEGDFVLRMLYIHPDTFPKGLIELYSVPACRSEGAPPYEAYRQPGDIPQPHRAHTHRAPGCRDTHDADARFPRRGQGCIRYASRFRQESTL